MIRKSWNLLGLLCAICILTPPALACDEHVKAAAAEAAVQAAAAEAAKAAEVAGSLVAAPVAVETTQGGCAHARKSASAGGCGKSSGCSKGKDCCATKGVGAVAKEIRTPAIEAVLASLPAMRYRVAANETACPAAAESMAVKADQPIRYVIGDKVFEKKNEASVALASLLEAELAKLDSVQSVSPQSGVACSGASPLRFVYRYGGVDFQDQELSGKAVALASVRKNETKISYKVGDESFCCDKMAGSRSKEVGKSITFTVNGEETCCLDSAKLMLVQAKIVAVISAAASIQGC